MFTDKISSVNKMGLFAAFTAVAFLAEAIVGMCIGFRPATVLWVVLAQVIVACVMVAWIDATYIMGYFFGLVMIVGSVSYFMSGHLQWKEAILFVSAIAASQWGTYHFRIWRNRRRALWG